MTLLLRIIFFGALGIIAGVLAWPFAEYILFYQGGFPSLLIFNVVLGVTVGLVMGGCFGSGEGIVSVSRRKIRDGVLAGFMIGVVAGMVGFVGGQAALHSIGTTLFNSTSRFLSIGYPMSKALGWATFGMCIGCVEGVRSRSLAKVRNGLVGGFLGGIVGGLVVEYLRVLEPESYYIRLVGLAVLGLSIGFSYGIVERRMTRASLRFLSGRFRGREFPLVQGKTEIGGSERVDINLEGYSVDPGVRIEIRRERGDFTLVDSGSQKGVFINDEKTAKTKLQDGDVIRIGNAQFLFTRL